MFVPCWLPVAELSCIMAPHQGFVVDSASYRGLNFYRIDCQVCFKLSTSERLGYDKRQREYRPHTRGTHTRILTAVRPQKGLAQGLSP